MCAISYAIAHSDILIEAEDDIVELTKREADGVVKLFLDGALPNKIEGIVSTVTTSQGTKKTKKKQTEKY